MYILTTYIKKRGDIYWFQRAVPKDVKPTIGRVNWAKSLKTSDIQTAKIRVRELAVETDQQIKRARDAEKVEELNRFAHRHMADLVSNCGSLPALSQICTTFVTRNRFFCGSALPLRQICTTFETRVRIFCLQQQRRADAGPA
ncbi:DUF6538 domain-containing protein [uncultured Pelagimonas sp.]|uniref:DUF6538 domain-containing protein n=1 Tax=uncultured Pelagimonas sp. TaxID=1618102 RepID=UPI003434A3AF